ncbi:DedA family protein [Parvularcula bermudensis HTCC2503]|uniref:DedA family protein n=1 Tax=Parvularcula bermudensis (strain ATCC BAA-594 / HTCC2503 / KCTC 12087) TaxID=314260 RepID=E0TII5_PARBH|nr:DedA family protein [Parvularcula bermudensis HTCC2503]
MSPRRFYLYTATGTFAWTAFLTLVGFWLGENYDAVEAWINPVSNVIAAGLAGWYLYRVATFQRRVRGSSAQ